MGKKEVKRIKISSHYYIIKVINNGNRKFFKRKDKRFISPRFSLKKTVLERKKYNTFLNEYVNNWNIGDRGLLLQLVIFYCFPNMHHVKKIL